MENSGLICEFCGGALTPKSELVPDYYRDYYDVNASVCQCGSCGAVTTENI